MLPPGEGRSAFTNRDGFLEKHGDDYDATMQSLARVLAELELLPQKPEEVFGFSRRTQELQTQLAFIMESEDKNTVFWIEYRGEGRAHVAGKRTLCCKPRRLMFRRFSSKHFLRILIPPY